MTESLDDIQLADPAFRKRPDKYDIRAASDGRVN